MGGTGAMVSPTHVGMDRTYPIGLSLAASEPHARGDGPSLGESLAQSLA